MSEDYLKVFLQNMEKERQGKVESGELIQPVEKKLSPVELEENILPDDSSREALSRNEHYSS